MPPDTVKHPPQEVRWRWTLSLAVTGLLAALVWNVAIAYGVLPPLWYAPETQIGQIVAQVTDLQAQTKMVERDVDMSLKLDLGKELRDNQANRCTATNNAQKVNLSNVIDSEQQYYFSRFGTYYTLPRCDQL